MILPGKDTNWHTENGIIMIMNKHDPSDHASRLHLRLLARLQQIHEAISAGRCPSICELTRNTGLSERTIKRDLKALRDTFQAPLVYDRQRRGYRYENPGWELPPVRFTEGELLAFFTAHHIMKTLGHAPEVTLLQSALAKLATLLPEQVSFNPHTISAALTFQSMPYVMVEPTFLGRLTRAATEMRTLFIQYHSQYRDELTERKVDVLHLHNFAGDWYAIAFDHQRRDIRDFHVGRIRYLQETDDFFTPPPGWNADTHLRSGFFMMRGGRQTMVSIVFDAYQARWIRERLTFHADEQREDLPDGELRLSFPVGSNGLDAVARFCLAYAGHCRVEKPAALRKIMRERLREALNQHPET
jgi:predicted DNA-binding transcriptional regulator YafY